MSNYQLSINNYQLPEGYKQTEVGVIPEGWEIRSCSEISERIVVGIVIRPTQYYVPQGVPAFRSANIREDGITDSDLVFISEASNKLLAKSQTRAGDILTVRTGYPGTSAVVRSQHAGCNCIDILVTRPSPKVVNSDYLAIWINSSFGKDQVLRNQGGLAQKHFNVGDMRELLVALPKPEEQRAIATALSDVDALIAALDKLIAKKRYLKTATMQQLLTGKKRLPGFGEGKGYKQTEVGVIPEDWEVRPLLKAVSLPTGQVDPRTEPYKLMVLIAPDHIESGSGRLIEQKTAAEQGAISGKYLFSSGDIIYSKIRPYLRKAVLPTFEGLCSADMYPLTPAEDVSSEFIFAILLGRRFSQFADTVSARSGIPKINREELGDFCVALPFLTEQRAIATVLSDMDGEIAALEARRAKTQAIKQGMMQQLLTGKVRLLDGGIDN